MRYIATIILILLVTAFSLAEDSLTVIKAKKTIILNGYTRNEKTIVVSSEVSGKIVKINYDIGDTIGKKPFIEIDPTFINLQIESTKQSINKLETSRKRLDSRISYLKKIFSRINTLHKDDLAAEDMRDSAFQKLEQARLERNSIIQEKGISQTKLTELDELKKRHSIFVPEGWIITEKTVEEGEYTHSGKPLGWVSNYNKLIVPLSITSEEYTSIKSLPEIFYAKLEGIPVKASIKWVNPKFDEKVRKLNIEILIKKYTGERRGGLRFTLPLTIDTEGLLVPKEAIISRYKNTRVKIKATGKVVNLLVLGNSGDYMIVAEDKDLRPGIELLPAISMTKD